MTEADELIAIAAAALRQLHNDFPRPNRRTDGRTYEIGPGFVRARECLKCGHTRCGNDCACSCRSMTR